MLKLDQCHLGSGSNAYNILDRQSSPQRHQTLCGISFKDTQNTIVANCVIYLLSLANVKYL
jgi:hypothetical protein